MVTEKLVSLYAKSIGFDCVENTGKRFKGCDVWHAFLDAPDGVVLAVGYPAYILVKGMRMRMATPDEKFEIMGVNNGKTLDEMSDEERERFLSLVVQ